MEMQDGSIDNIYCIPRAPTDLDFWLKVNPPKQGPFQSKQGSFGFQVPAIKNDKQPRIVKLSLLELSAAKFSLNFRQLCSCQETFMLRIHSEDQSFRRWILKKTGASLPEPVFLDLSCFLFRKKNAFVGWKQTCFQECQHVQAVSPLQKTAKPEVHDRIPMLLEGSGARSGGIMTSRFSVRPEELEKTFSTLQSADARMGKKNTPRKTLHGSWILLECFGPSQF